MAEGSFVSYLRVSTRSQGQSGLGIEAQREAVNSYLTGGAATLVAEYVEVESGSSAERPELASALRHVRMTGSTLVVAKLDRLARDTRFLMNLLHNTGDQGVVFCDLPHLPSGAVGKFLIQQMAAVAELERGLISQRTKAALAAAKARGVVLGGFRGVVPDPKAAAEARISRANEFASLVGEHALALRHSGLTLRCIANRLTLQGVRTARGGAWTPTAVKCLLHRYSSLRAA